ncbi:hypothetical protein PCASD_21414 [Puccinia coronata f. sp. avenae]|uniref:Uncharacterized protein n=1 Tax=Puccinia coronata f. sp. avenae TaxID=200324 RepID=A0A2N5SGU0_9BASI|nr:hypothetical protein PCASD_21414 [Puccinia coronata f. sp. avenae]
MTADGGLALEATTTIPIEPLMAVSPGPNVHRDTVPHSPRSGSQQRHLQKAFVFELLKSHR